MKILSIIFSLLVLSSCASYTPFTSDLYSDLNLEERTIKKVQFYLSQDIVLFRDAGHEEVKVSNGRIKVKNGRRIQEVVIRRNTPGVLLFMPKENRFAVSFENNDKNFLIFGPNERLNDKYTLLGKEWDKDFGKITYGGQVFETSTRNAMASLLVDMNKMRKVNVKRTEVRGRKI